MGAWSSSSLGSWSPIAVNNKCLVRILPQTHTSAFLSGEVDPWETVGDIAEPEPETVDAARSAAADAEEDEDEDDPWDMASLVSSDSSNDGRASTSDDDETDYLPFTEEQRTQRNNRQADKRKRREEKEMELLEAAFTSARDPMPWETAGGKVKGWGKWGKARGKGEANKRQQRKV